MSMKKLFLKFSMLLFVLGLSMNAAWAINISGMTPEEAETEGFWARLTAQPATTTNGSGKVFVVTAEDYEGDPTDGDYAAQMNDDGWSDIFLASSLINADVQFRTFAKADDGSYFTGWSFTDGYTDLGTVKSDFWVKVTPSATKAHANIRNYNLYAAFLPVQLVSYEMVSGSQEVADDGAGNWKCTQTIKFRAETPGFWALSSGGDERHFKRPVIAKKTGTTGTWTIDDAEWISSGVGQNVSLGGDYAELTVPVTFTAPNGDVGEYAATVTLETYAGVKMTAYLYARRTVAGAEAIRYNKSKVLQEAGALAGLLDNADADDIIKLNGNYSSAVEINKNITFDLNGYSLSNTLTVSGGNVTVAYSAFGGSANALSVTGGKAILNGGTFGTLSIGANGTVEQNGATITGTATNEGSLTTTDGKFQGGLTSSKTLIANGGTFSGSVAINVTGGSAQIKRGTITGTTYGVQSAGTTTIEKLAKINGSTKALKRTAGTLTVNNGKFSDPADLAEGDIVFNAAFFQNNGGELTTVHGKQVWRNTAGTEFNDGYNFFAGDQAAAQASNVSVCRIGHTSYNSLEEALAYANNNPSEGVIIIMENDYTLKAGYYTLPAQATLIVPMSNDQETANQIVPRETSGTPAPVSFRKLIFENGVNMEVAGTIEVTCTQYGSGETMGIPGGNYGHLILKPGSHMTINNGGYLRAWGFVTGDGTKDGAGNYLFGEIDVRRGGTVHEMFQMGDWKGGDISFTIAMEIPGMNPCWRDMAHLFPIYTYFIQNVESPVKYHPGSSLICATSVNVAGNINAYANDIKVVGKEGEPAMFLMDEMADAENTWVRKYYDAKKDQQVYEVNSGAQLGSMVINLGEVPAAMISPGTPGTLNLVLDSRKFVLPLTNNFKIHLLSGYMQFTQSTSCLPGMEVEIDKESEVSIIKNDDATIVSGGLYFYDADQWSFQNMGLGGYVGTSGKYGAIVRYSATWDLGTNGETKTPNVRNITSPATIGDAILNVHGTFRMGENCAVYTTWSKNMDTFTIDESGTGGASVISSDEDAGTFIFDADAPTFDGIHMEGMDITGFGPNVIVNYDHNDYGITSPIAYPVKIPTVLNQSTPTPVFGVEFCTPVRLQNADGTFVKSEGTLAGTSYCYRNGQWTTMQVAEDECFMKEIVSGQTTYYAKPAEYVAVNATKIMDGENFVELKGNDDHTFSDAAGAGRLFILMADDCQWWEVEKKDNLYHCIHPNNDTYYYWDEDEDMWMEQRFSITWLNWDGEEIKSYTYDPVTGDPEEVAYSVTYGTMAEYHGSNPTREPSSDYTYVFAGWSPELGPVKSDVTYTAVYTQQPRKYTIIFNEEGGAEIERQFLLLNEMPACENTPSRTGFTLEWEPALAAVTGDATYRATWLENPPTEYEITFYDYDGTTVLKQGNVNVGDMPVPPAQVNGKPATSEYTYVFDHWSPAVEKVSATSAKSYTAVYREEAKTFPVNFYFEQEDAEHKIGATQFLEIGQTPAIPDDERLQLTEDDANVYQLVWTPQIQTVVGHAGDYTYNYVASYTSTPKQYSLTLKCTPSGAAVITGARADYAYGATPTITVTPNAGYNFVGWSDNAEQSEAVDGTYSRTVTINGNVELTVICECPDCDKSTINWMNENGEGDPLSTDLIPVGSATIFHGTTPIKASTDQYAYTFYGWTTEANEGGTKYKNGMTPVVAAAEQTYTYYACFTPVIRQYNIALSSSIPNVCMLVGAGSYDYSESYKNATVIVSGYDAVNYTFDGWYNGEDRVSTAESYSFAVQNDVDLVATFSPVTYTITWKSEDGNSTLETDADQAYGAATAYNSAEPTKENYSFIGWTTAANGEGSFYAKGATPAVSGDATYYAYFAANSTSLEIGATSSETLTEATDYTSFTIISNGENSGQLINANYLSLLGEAIFKLQPESGIPARTWYAVAAPWQVDVHTGIYANGSHLNVGMDFDIIEFDAESYATKEAGTGNTNIWKYVEENSGVMQPGKLYMIYLASAKTSLEFHKTGGGISTTTLSLTTTSGSGDKANWNAIANPALYHADLNMTVIEDADHDVLQYINGGYTLTTAENMIVGQPIFVQVNNPQSTVEANIHDGAPAPAYRRAPQAQTVDNRFVVEIARNGKMNDRLIVQTADEKENTYVIGQDLAKMGVGTKTAQMWMNRYNTKLCKNTVEMANDYAEYPLNIYAPTAGEYTLTAAQQRGDVDLYLTLNGEAIWNLSEGAYVVNLNKGTDANYGLRISARKTPTGVDEAIVDAQSDTRKVIIDNKVFIIRGEKVYTVDGQLVK